MPQKLKVKSAPSKRIYLELLRIIAIISVVFNHTGDNGWLYYTHAQGVVAGIFLLLSVLCKVSVPLFLMISGAVLLGKDEDLKTLLKKRIFKMVITILFVSLVHYFYICLRNSYQMSVAHFLTTALTTYNVCSYYLWLYLAFLLTLPFLRSMVRSITVAQTLYLASFYMVISCIFPLLQINVTNLTTYLFLHSGIVIFPILGYTLDQASEAIYTKKWLLSGGIVSLCFILTNYVARYHYFIQQGMDTENYSACAAALGVYLFYVTKYLFTKYADAPFLVKAAPLICLGGQLSFGIFIFSDIVLWEAAGIYTWMSAVLPWNLACIVWIIVTVILCGLLTQVLRVICPPLKRILG